MKSIGIDIVEVKRFRNVPYKKGSVFYSKIFSDAEIKYCLSKDDPYPHFAARFAAKEAVLKCLKSTIYKIKEVEILNDKKGVPFVRLHGRKSLVVSRFLISLSHTKDQAAAIAFLQ
ncbi:MAG: holo-[acyl-carrier protein] synthase [Parcubacteria group bacterium Gr01-1014_19]|nr:MAG: holo-[acyl-carrier protein] synthase [Parcubacteria group bacterium Gr01-1014_19]